MAYLLQRLLTEAAARQPQRPAVASDGCLLTYQELDRLSNKMARALLRLGVAPGDRVGILAPKSAAAVIGAYGALKAGACYVPLDPKAPAGRLSHIVGDCGAAVIVADEARTSQAAALAGAVPRPPSAVVASVPGRPRARGGGHCLGPGRGRGALDRGGRGIRGAVGGGTGDRDRPGVHLVHVGIDRHPEGGDDLPPQLADVRRVGGSRCGAQRAGPGSAVPRRCTSTCRSSTSSPPARPPRAWPCSRKEQPPSRYRSRGGWKPNGSRSGTRCPRSSRCWPAMAACGSSTCPACGR